MQTWKNKTAYITGGSTGIGRSVALRLVREGAHVVLFSRSREKLLQAVEELKRESSTDSQLIAYEVLDVSDHQQVEQIMRSSMERYGDPDFLVHTVGAAYPQYFEQISYQRFSEQIQTNLSGAWSVIHSLLPGLKRTRGTVVAVSSVSGFIGIFGYTAYSAAKFGLIGLCEALRNELKPWNVTVAVLCPPDTDTPGFLEENRTKPPETKLMSENLAIMSPEKVADALFSGLSRGKFLIVPGFFGKLSLLLKRWAPSLMFRIIDGDLKRARRKLGKDKPEKSAEKQGCRSA